MLVQPLQALLQLPAFVCVSPSIRAAAAEDAEGLRRIARRSTVVNALSGPRRLQYLADGIYPRSPDTDVWLADTRGEVNELLARPRARKGHRSDRSRAFSAADALCPLEGSGDAPCLTPRLDLNRMVKCKGINVSVREERKKQNRNPREGWEDGTPPPHNITIYLKT